MQGRAWCRWQTSSLGCTLPCHPCLLMPPGRRLLCLEGERPILPPARRSQPKHCLGVGMLRQGPQPLPQKPLLAAPCASLWGAPKVLHRLSGWGVVYHLWVTHLQFGTLPPSDLGCRAYGTR